jgi:hypothetical protein
LHLKPRVIEGIYTYYKLCIVTKTIIWDFIAPCPGFLPESIYKSKNRDFPEGIAGKSNYSKPVSQKLSEIWFSDLWLSDHSC